MVQQAAPERQIAYLEDISMRLRRISALDFYTVTFGLFLFVSPWLFAYANEGARIDLWASGAVIAAMSVAAIIAFADWEEWLNLLLGFWLMVSPWMLGFAHTGAMHVGIGVGAMVAFVAALELWLVHFEPSYGSTPQL
jgi:SPW repeat